jgi:hypothetical protein
MSNEHELSNSIKKLLENAVQPTVPLNGELVAVRNKDGGYDIVNTRKLVVGASPHGRAGTAKFNALEDFIGYIKAYASGEELEGVVMWAEPKMIGSTVYVGEAILDYHQGGIGGIGEILGYCRNRAVLYLALHPLYQVVAQMFEWQEQTDFANLIRAAGTVWAKPSRADMLTLSRDLRITSAGEYANAFDDASGSRNIVYRQTNSAAVGGTSERTLVVPEQIEIMCPMLLDSPSYPLTLRLETRPPQKSGSQCMLRLVYDSEVIDRLEIVDQAIHRIREAGIYVLRGSYEHKPIVAG